MGEIFQEDCRATMRRSGIAYDYALLSPPDFHDVGLHPKRDGDAYRCLLREALCLLNPRKRVVTIVASDRRCDGIVPKHCLVIELMEQLGYRYLDQKIWCKSLKINLFRLNYAFVMSFAKGRCQQRMPPAYRADVWCEPPESGPGLRDAFPLAVARRCIDNFTDPGDTIYDPFMGSGTTALASLQMGRDYLGSEIDPVASALASSRIRELLEPG